MSYEGNKYNYHGVMMSIATIAKAAGKSKSTIYGRLKSGRFDSVQAAADAESDRRGGHRIIDWHASRDPLRGGFSPDIDHLMFDEWHEMKTRIESYRSMGVSDEQILERERRAI